MDRTDLDNKPSTMTVDEKVKDICAYKLLQISQMLSYVATYKTTRDYMYFGWKLKNGNVKIYDLIRNEYFIENAKKLKIKYAITKRDITFSRV